jgi:hypothetical protein
MLAAASDLRDVHIGGVFAVLAAIILIVRHLTDARRMFAFFCCFVSHILTFQKLNANGRGESGECTESFRRAPIKSQAKKNFCRL